MKNHKQVGALITIAMLVVSNWAVATEYAISDEVREKLEPVLGKSGAELNYFEGPAGMIGVGLTFVNGKQMVAYATADGSTLFSGAAIDVETGINWASADMQKLPAPNYKGVLDRLSGAAEGGQRTISIISEGNLASENHYYVFVDPTCGFCHKTYSNFLKVLADGQDLVVHYIPVGILGPEAQNLAKEILATGGEGGLEILRKLVRKEQHLTNGTLVAKGSEAFDGNMSVFRELGFSGVPAVVSDVGGNQTIRSGMITAEAIEQELRVAAVKKVAMAQQ